MASEDRDAAPDLTRLDALKDAPQKFHIFQALRLIEAAHDDRPRLGRSRKPSEDAVRLEQEAELAFPPSTISDYQLGKEGAPDRMANRFFGLFGPNGPLPLHLTEFARDRLRNHRDPTFVSFANLFHHRMTSLFYRAWSAAQPAPSFDRSDDDPFGEKIDALMGRLGQGFKDRDAMPDLAKRHFAGLLGQGPHNEDGLLAIIRGFLKIPVRIQTFVGTWLFLEEQDRWQLGYGNLGHDTSIGQKVWSRSSKFCLMIGPLDRDSYQRMLPGGQSLKRLKAIVQNYVTDDLEWDVNLILREADVPDTRLGQSGQLGYTTWIGQRSAGTDADDLYLAAS
ncbi:MAG: type VI secretion system baseplate subunit TssG [Pseudomonadota bacterium]